MDYADYHPEDELATHMMLLNLQHREQSIVAFGLDAPLDDLASLLREKGVPKENAQDRAKQVMAKLGPQQVRQIMMVKNPWAALKAAAN